MISSTNLTTNAGGGYTAAACENLRNEAIIYEHCFIRYHCNLIQYRESDEFEILLFGISVDGGPVVVYDLACGDTVPNEILAALSDENVTKWACRSLWKV